MDRENAAIIVAHNATPRWMRWPMSMDEYRRYFLAHKITTLISSLIAWLLVAIPPRQDGVTADRIYGCNDMSGNGCANKLLVPIVLFPIFIVITIVSLVVVVRRNNDSFVIWVDGAMSLVIGCITFVMSFMIYEYVVVWMPPITDSTTEMSSTGNSTLCSDCYKYKRALCFCNGYSCMGCYEYMRTHDRIVVASWVVAIFFNAIIVSNQLNGALMRWNQNRLKKALEAAGLLPNPVPVLTKEDPVKGTNERVKSDHAVQGEPIEANQEKGKKQEVISEVG